MTPECPQCGTQITSALGSRFIEEAKEMEYYCNECRTLYNQYGEKVVYGKNGRQVMTAAAEVRKQAKNG